jgi:hypothetical protein
MHGPTCIFWANLTPCSLKDSPKECHLYATSLAGVDNPVDGGEVCRITQAAGMHSILAVDHGQSSRGRVCH